MDSVHIALGISVSKTDQDAGLIGYDSKVPSQFTGACAKNCPNTRLPTKVPPRIDRKYPTFIVMTAIILSIVSHLLQLLTCNLQ